MIQSQFNGHMTVEFEIKEEHDFIAKAFETVRITFPFVVGDERFDLPLIPKIKDENGTIHCVLDEEGEVLFAMMKSRRERLMQEWKQHQAVNTETAQPRFSVIKGGKS